MKKVGMESGMIRRLLVYMRWKNGMRKENLLEKLQRKRGYNAGKKYILAVNEGEKLS